MGKSVDFISAVNSGKRFKFKGTSDSVLFTGKDLWFNARTQDLEWFTREVVNAQFELEEKSITITESQFDDAVEEYVNGRAFPTTSAPHKAIANMKKELGFK